MSKKKTKNLTLVEWCDQQVEEGHELSMSWEGGDDSGWVSFLIDGEDVTDNAQNVYIKSLLDHMYNTLDYGSWAGDFNASGEAIYSSEEKAFIGTDYYRERDRSGQDVNIKVLVPEDIWFDSMDMRIEAEVSSEITTAVNINFSVKNGFMTDEHRELEDKLQDEIGIKVGEAVEKYEQRSDDFMGINEGIVLQANDFKKKKDGYEYTIESLEFETENTTEKDVNLYVPECHVIKYNKNEDRIR